MHLSICLFVCVSVCVFVSFSHRLFMYLTFCLFLCVSVCVSVSLSHSLFEYLTFFCLFVCESVCLFLFTGPCSYLSKALLLWTACPRFYGRKSSGRYHILY